MQPHIVITNVNKEEQDFTNQAENPPPPPSPPPPPPPPPLDDPQTPPARKTLTQGRQQGGRQGRRGDNKLNLPTFETSRRPSFLPNDTQMTLRPKLRKMSTYDLGVSEAGSLESHATPEGQIEELEDTEPPPCLHGAFHWITGDVQYISDHLEHWPILSPFLPLRLLNATLRTLGAPLLANNPFSGALVLAALLLEKPMVALWGVAALLIAMLTAVVLRQPQHIVSSGLVTQHGLLLGLLVGHGYGRGYGEARAHAPAGLATTAVIVGVTAAVSVLTGNAVSTLMSQTNLPGLTLSYMLIGTPLCAALGFRDTTGALGVPSGPPLPSVTPSVITSPPVTAATLDTPFVNITSRASPPRLQWSLVLQGVVRGAGQVYGCEGLIASGLVFAATLVFSPIVFGQALLGTLTGALCGTLLDEPPYTALYAGLYGRHSLLTALSLGGFFFVLNFYSTLAGVFGGVLATILFHALRKSPLAVLTTPHVISTLILLHARLGGGLLKRVDLIYLSFPEMHRRLFRPGNAVEDCVDP